MICFLDRTFCSSDCTNSECSRNLTPELRAGARRWWGRDCADEDIPIAFTDYKTGCNRYLAPRMAPVREQTAPERERKARKRKQSDTAREPEGQHG